MALNSILYFYEVYLMCLLSLQLFFKSIVSYLLETNGRISLDKL